MNLHINCLSKIIELLSPRVLPGHTKVSDCLGSHGIESRGGEEFSAKFRVGGAAHSFKM